MNLHLNNDQIDGLLQATAGGKPNVDGNRECLEDARRHLEDCAVCQTRMHAHEQAIDRLASLKVNTPGATGPMCPPDGVWADVAAGIFRGDSKNLRSHAAQCDHCGPLLRQTKEDLTHDPTPEEESRIADLSSSTTEWQQRLAEKIRDTQILVPVVPRPKYWSPSVLWNLPEPWRLAFAGVVIGLIVLGVRDYRRIAYLSAQNLEATAEIRHLEQSVLQQNTQIAQLTSESRRSSTPAPLSGTPSVGEVDVASLVLDPGLTRGMGDLKSLTVPQGTEIAKITLHLEELPSVLLREDLITAEGQRKWSQELHASEPEKRSHSLSLLVPVYLLTPNDYQIVLSRHSSVGFEPLATYTFRVTR